MVRMRSLISLITQASIYRTHPGTKYLCEQSPGGIFTKFCNGTWKFFGCTNTHAMPVSTNCLRNPPEILQSSRLLVFVRRSGMGQKRRKLWHLYLLLNSVSVGQSLGRALCRHNFLELLGLCWGVLALPACSCRQQKASRASLFPFYFPPSSKWSHKQLGKITSELLPHLHSCSLPFLSSCSSFCSLKMLFFTEPRYLSYL